MGRRKEQPEPTAPPLSPAEVPDNVTRVFPRANES